jgi:hypothetical protein
MSNPKPRPDLWSRTALVVAMLRRLLRACAPEAFAAISAEARALLAAATAMVRRYIHALAADILLPPARVSLGADNPLREERASRNSNDYLFPLAEHPGGRASRHCPPEPPELQWAILWEAAARLAAVMANPAPHALRLARCQRRVGRAPLRDMPVRWHVIRRLGPVIDALLTRLDQAARPWAWEGLDTS